MHDGLCILAHKGDEHSSHKFAALKIPCRNQLADKWPHNFASHHSYRLYWLLRKTALCNHARHRWL